MCVNVPLQYIPRSLSNQNHHSLTEVELIALLRSQDKAALGILYDRYAPNLYGVLCKILKSDMIAEEVLQDTFVKVWRHIDNYDSTKGKLYTWLLTIARRTAIDKLRSSEMTVQIQDLTENVHFIDQHNPTIVETDFIGLREGLQHLREEYRLLIEMAYFGGYTQDEISQELAMPLGTVKTRIRNALIELRKIYKP